MSTGHCGEPSNSTGEAKTVDQGSQITYEQRLRHGGEFMLREASAYFAGGGDRRDTLRRLAQRLDELGIAYALIGGLALAEHGYPRLTEDIDLVLNRLRDLADVQDLIVRLVLPFDLANLLDASVRDAHVALWRSVQDSP